MRERLGELERRKSRSATGGCVCFHIRKASRAVTHLFDGLLEPSGLRVTQFTVLVVVARFGSPTISGLAERLVMDRTTLARDLRPLERQGLIRIGSGEDRRTRVITLTPRGRQALRRAFPLWRRAQARVVGRLGSRRWDALREELSALVSLARAG